ncbi:hypothetical protein MIMGU_mgv1a016921mg [Erythranthe guttata]|uniref:Secreted protein n=1 Tax=Erythranthe guttata TaxID=4155 RepID=A0A022QBN7_ERYGU|nr:hypothetical protein MIMGU_mgv1a016921mg [Erythranthe guttata]
MITSLVNLQSLVLTARLLVQHPRTGRASDPVGGTVGRQKRDPHFIEVVLHVLALPCNLPHSANSWLARVSPWVACYDLELFRVSNGFSHQLVVRHCRPCVR